MEPREFLPSLGRVFLTKGRAFFRRQGPRRARRHYGGGMTLGPVLWLVGLAVLFLLFDEGQRVRRRVKALEERLDRLEGGGGIPS